MVSEMDLPFEDEAVFVLSPKIQEVMLSSR